jgi:hypothetical protein
MVRRPRPTDWCRIRACCPAAQSALRYRGKFGRRIVGTPTTKFDPIRSRGEKIRFGAAIIQGRGSRNHTGPQSFVRPGGNATITRSLEPRTAVCCPKGDRWPMSNARHRSFELITRADLRRLTKLAVGDFDGFFRRHKRWRPYADRLMLICLCQGAARHYCDPKRTFASEREGGVNDFDVWGFFRKRPNLQAFPYRRHGVQDFGPSKFGRSPNDEQRFTGRRIDVFGRSIETRRSETPIEATQRYLRENHTNSAGHLAKRPVVVLWPENDCGRIIWRGDAEPSARGRIKRSERSARSSAR